MPSRNELHRKWLRCRVCGLSIHPDDSYWSKYTLLGDRIAWHHGCDKAMEEMERE